MAAGKQRPRRHTPCRLPAGVTQAQTQQAVERARSRAAAKSRSVATPPRILLAEDDGPFRFLLSSVLRKEGYQVVGVSTGVDLLDVLDASVGPEPTCQAFDLVLSDVRMPGWPGLEGLARLGHDPAMPPFILFTAFGDEEAHERAIEIGAVTLLDKPFDIDQLRDLVAQVLA
jgi:two-component system response regulator (stage 0 sporulation protein F)